MTNTRFKPVLKTEMISRTFHLDINHIKHLKDISSKLGISQSELVRRSIAHFIDEFDDYQKQKSINI